MHVRDGSAGNGNNGCDPEDQLPAGERSTVQIQLQPGALAVLINGEAKCEGDRNDGRTIHENARVFASDPWHAATLATINNFYVASMIPASGCTDGAACNYDRNPAVDDD
jgi:hypothetical protein